MSEHERWFKIIDGNVGFGLDFTDQVLNYASDCPVIPDTVILMQPEFDRNGKKCPEGGTYSVHLSNVEEVRKDGSPVPTRFAMELAARKAIDNIMVGNAAEAESILRRIVE